MTTPNNQPISDADLELFREYYAKNPTWGSLHIVLEDGNVKDTHVQHCIEYAMSKNDGLGEGLARLLLTKSKSQRINLPNRL